MFQFLHQKKLNSLSYTCLAGLAALLLCYSCPAQYKKVNGNVLDFIEYMSNNWKHLQINTPVVINMSQLIH